MKPLCLLVTSVFVTCLVGLTVARANDPEWLDPQVFGEGRIWPVHGPQSGAEPTITQDCVPPTQTPTPSVPGGPS